MIRLLVIIAVVGFLTAIVTLGGAAALGGRDLAARDWQWNWVGGPGPWRSHHDHGPGFATTTRELTWDGSEALDLAVPAELVFTQGGTGPGQLTITGPKYIVDALTLAEGRLDDGLSHHRRGRLKILMTAPKVTRFDLGGSSRLTIGAYAQDSLEVRASGSSEVAAQGQTKTLKLSLGGSSEADVGALSAETAEVKASGASEATLAARDRATLDLSGSSEVRLTTKPTKLEKSLSGSSKVVEVGE